MWAPKSFAGVKLLDRCDYVKCDQLSAKKLDMDSIWIVGAMPRNLCIYTIYSKQLPKRIEWNWNKRKEHREIERIFLILDQKWSKKGRFNVDQFGFGLEWTYVCQPVCLNGTHTTRSNIHLRPACALGFCAVIYLLYNPNCRTMHAKTTKDTHRIFSYDRADDCAEHFIENRATRRNANTKSKLSIDSHTLCVVRTYTLFTIHTQSIYIGLCVH